VSGAHRPPDPGPRVVQLYLLRHAHAGDPLAWKGNEADRPLSGRGRKQTARLARFLEGVGFRPDAVISSPKLRALQTAEGVARRLDLPVLVDYRLAEELDLENVELILSTAGDPQRPLLVGHDPAFSALAAALLGVPRFDLAKGALVRIDVGRPLQAGEGLIRWLVPPDLLKAERSAR
jgi:phosphohistidine phosphatase